MRSLLMLWESVSFTEWSQRNLRLFVNPKIFTSIIRILGFSGLGIFMETINPLLGNLRTLCLRSGLNMFWLSTFKHFKNFAFTIYKVGLFYSTVPRTQRRAFQRSISRRRKSLHAKLFFTGSSNVRIRTNLTKRFQIISDLINLQFLASFLFKFAKVL